MAQIDVKFMKGNKSTLKGMSTVYSEKKGMSKKVQRKAKKK